jgi:stage II sporulation protein D
MTVPDTRVRVAVKRNVERASLYTVGEVGISGASRSETEAYRGRIVAEANARTDRALLRMGPLKMQWVALPCTLLSRDNGNFFELDDASYRGSFIVCSEQPQKITIVNYLDVEDYLRGVVPLEIGKRPPEEVEAVKAQAVAARTYSYRRAVLRSDQPYDMVATIEDQVYGGVSAEVRECDDAIRATRGLVLVYGDSLINAYYCSTCGGRTANIQDVWDKPPAPYLRSVRDAAPNGQPYCAISSYCTWTEIWSTPALSSIIVRYAASAGFDCPDRGSIRDLTVKSRYECGRVKSLVIRTSTGSCEVGGDKVRFVLRREGAGSPILRSANFSVVSVDGRRVSIEGHGYGHGVGMCQMGAVGRAQSGHTFGEILGAYYPGAEIERVVTGR